MKKILFKKMKKIIYNRIDKIVEIFHFEKNNYFAFYF